MAADDVEPDRPKPVAVRHAMRVAKLMYVSHRRPPQLPWHPLVTGAIGFVSTVGGSAYSTPDFDAVAVVWRFTPGGLAAGFARVVAAASAVPVAALVIFRSWSPPVIALGVEALAGVSLAVLFEVSSRRAQKRWLAKPRNVKPGPGEKVDLFRMGHLVGFGVGAATPHAADAMCRSIAQHSDLPLYLVATTRAHARLYRRFGFEPVGPSWYGETPMRRAAGPVAATKAGAPRGDAVGAS